MAPITIREFQSLEFASTTPFDGVVCVGCDGRFGPELEFFKKLRRPFSLYLEHPPVYRPSAMLASSLAALPSVRIVSTASFNISASAAFEGIEKPFRENRMVQHLHYA